MDVKEYFNNIAKEWINEIDLVFVKSLLDKVEIFNGANVLDVGCGKGVITPILYEYSKRCVDGIDISDKMISYTTNNEKHVFYCGDVLTYEFKKKYDFIIIFDAYPHILDKDALAKKAFELLKEKGKLAIIHDISRIKLNTHHQQFALLVSKELNDPNKEYEHFNKYFNKLLTIDDDKSYLLLLEKK